TEAGASVRGTWVVRSVPGNVEAVDVPAAGRIRRLTDRDVEVVDSSEPTGRRVGVERECNDEEALRRGVVEAARIGHERPELDRERRPLHGRRVAEEGVQINGVVHVTREARDDVSGCVIRERGCCGPGVEAVEGG